MVVAKYKNIYHDALVLQNFKITTIKEINIPQLFLEAHVRLRHPLHRVDLAFFFLLLSILVWVPFLLWGFCSSMMDE